MFGNPHPTLLRIQQVASEMSLLLLDPSHHLGVERCKAFHARFGVAISSSIFDSQIGFYRQSHYLGIRIDERIRDQFKWSSGPLSDPRMAYVGVHSSTGEYVVFHSRRNGYPEYLPDYTKDSMVVFNPTPSDSQGITWAAKNMLDFFLWED